MDKELEYTARFVGVHKEIRREFKNAGCLLVISVGQLYHEREKFDAAIKLVNKNFAFCDILVSDTLQQHTLHIDNRDKSEDELYILAKEAGSAWIERNMQYISTLTIPYKISRWDEWLKEDKYKHYYEKVCELYNNNIVYKDMVHKVAHEFLARRDDLNIEDKQAAFNLSIKYLLEESAVSCLFEGKYKFCMYPSDLYMITACTRLINGNNAQSRMINFRVDKPLHSNISEFKNKNHKYIAANYVLNHAPGHIYWKSLAGVYLGCNIEHANYCGFDSPGDIIGKTDEKLIGKDNAATVADVDMRVMTEDIEHVVEEYDKNNDKYFLSKKVPLKDKDNKIIGILGTSIDITEQKKLELSLEKATKDLEIALFAKTEFLNNMSHEIRTPVSGFTSISEGLVENWDILDNEKKFKYVKDIANSAERLGSLISNLLDLSTFITNKRYIHFTKIDLNELVESVIDETKALYAQNKVIHINYTPRKDLFAKVDKGWIVQVFRHLFCNAVKYSANEGIITVKLDKMEDSLHFSIEDNGVGIPVDEVKEIFLPFTQSSRTKTGAGGRGLGLAICKEIIEAHKGRTWAENNVVQGATFHFVIPIINDDE